MNKPFTSLMVWHKLGLNPKTRHDVIELIASEAIGLFQEYYLHHEYDAETAMSKAIAECLEGLGETPQIAKAEWREE